MILSNQNLFSDKQDATAAADSDNVIDLGPKGTPVHGAAALLGDVGKGNPVETLIQFSSDFDADDFTVEVMTGDDPDDLDILAASLTANADVIKSLGYRFPVIYLPNGISGRYVGLTYTPAEGASAGTVTAGITLGVQTNISSP